MSWLVTPRQFDERAEWYRQLAQLLTAGIGLLPALETLHRHPPNRSYRGPLRQILNRLESGATFAEALTSVRDWLKPLDLAVVRAGEMSGRLPEVCRGLGEHYALNARLLRKLISSLMYPLGLLHFAIFLFPFPQLFISGDVGKYLGQTLGIALPLDLSVVVAVALLRADHPGWQVFLEQVIGRVPVLGTGWRHLALARLATGLEALISAGINVLEAWQVAAQASGSQRIRRAVAQWRSRLEQGATPSQMLEQTPVFPELFANLYHTGEVSGKLDEALRDLHRYYSDTGTQKLDQVAEWLPKIVYLAVVLWIAWHIVQFWQGYFGQVSDVLRDL